MGIKEQVGQVDGASIGGSGTWGMRFPEDLDVEVIEYFDSFDTPYGKTTVPWKLIDVDGARILRVAFHGIDTKGGQPIWEGALQTAYVLSQAQAPWAIVDASVGGIKIPVTENALLPPWSIVVPDSFHLVDAPTEYRSELVRLMQEREGTVRMGKCFHPNLREALYQSAQRTFSENVFLGGQYVCTPTGPFETCAEVEMYRQLGYDIVGRTLGYEAPLARIYGYPLAALNIVANYAEGRSPDPEWIEGGMVNFYHECASPMGEVTLSAIRYVLEDGIDESHDDPYRTSVMSIFPIEGA